MAPVDGGLEQVFSQNQLRWSHVEDGPGFDDRGHYPSILETVL
jgi:hypothetical protein